MGSMGDMNKQFFCGICGIPFSSGYELAEHFRSKEHRDKAAGGNLVSLIDKFISGIKADIDSEK